MTILERILARRRADLAAALERVGREELARRAEAVERAPRGLAAALQAGPAPRVIAEIKRRSPSRGWIRPDLEPVAWAKSYADAGAAAISVLTEPHFFGGELATLAAVRAAVDLPLLRKDFLIDPYQVDEARVHGADAVLLIVAVLGRHALDRLMARARQLGLDALVEVHDERELDVALEAGARLIGVNHRDLRSFEVDLGITERLARRVPPGVVVVAESGIREAADVRRLVEAGAHAVLVGEALAREADPGLALRRLRGET